MSKETETIKERIDLAELISETVQLKKAGNHWKGLCPFHAEKTPSFVVSPGKGIWHCFGCGEGGDHFAFVQRVEGVEFPEALQQLADRAGVALPKRSESKAATDARTRQFELLELTARFFHEVLMNQPAGAEAKKYLEERGVSEESMMTFQIGYGLHSWDATRNYLKGKGFSDDELIRVGLCGRTERGKLYDRFRGRVMFPIYDVRGRVVAFGGRILPMHETGGEGKYVNSPETATYEKRRVVYNLNRAKKHLAHQPALVVEGYLDVVMLAQVGVHNAVASSGTAFTEEQVQLLKRYTDELHFAFDADTAGVKAAVAATEVALSQGVRVSTILFPAGKDPADMATTEETELKKLLDSPQSLAQVLISRLEQVDGSNRDELLEQLLPSVRITQNPVQQGEMISEISRLLHVPEARIFELVQSAPRPAVAVDIASPESDEVRLSSSQLLLGLLLADTEARATVGAAIEPLLFPDGSERELATALQKLFAKRKKLLSVEASALFSELPDELVPLGEAARVRAEEHLENLDHDAVAEARELVRHLTVRHLEAKARQLESELLTQSGNGEERERVLTEIQQTTRQIESVKQQT